MLPSLLPLTPFVIPVKKRWEKGQEKKPRTLVIDPDAYHDENFSFADSLSSVASDSTSESDVSDAGQDDDDDDISYLDDYTEFVTTLLPGEAVVGEPMPKLPVEMGTASNKKDKTSVIERAWARFQQWRADERERRKHYIFREYEAKVAAYDAKLAAQLQHEIEVMKREVMREAHMINKRKILNSSKKPQSKWDANRKAIAQYTSLLEQRDEEERRMQFYCLNLQRWAVEKHDDKIRDAELKEFQRKEKEQKEAETARLAEKDQRKAIDAALLEEDVRITQEWKEMGRRIGALAAANVPVKLNLVDATDRGGGFRSKKSTRLVVGLKEDFDAQLLLRRRDPNAPHHDDGGGDGGEGGGGGGGRGGKDKRSRKPYTPFDTDLSGKTAHVLELVCTAIGERGALSLAAEFLRGACTSLETLDLSRCQIQTRGLGRLLHGIKLANLLSLRRLLLRGNDIGPRGLEYLKLNYTSGSMQDLQVLDLRENELGDAGADTLMRMIIAGYFSKLVELRLQHNGIGDVGFAKLVRVLQSMGHDKCPALRRVAMEHNPVSATAKRQYAPLAFYWSV